MEENQKEKISWKEALRRVPPRKWVLTALIGVVFLLAATHMEKGMPVTGSSKGGDDTQAQKDNLGSSSYETRLEERLKNILSSVEGAGQVEVIITFRDSGEKIVNKDIDNSSSIVTEQDSAGGARTSEEKSYQEDTILSGDSYNSGTPYVVQEINPSVEGILVVSDGGDSPVVVEKITDALSALFNLSPHKIKVLKRES